MEKPITRIDFEATPEGALRRMWREGWQQGDECLEEKFLEGRKLLPLLLEAGGKGWSVTQFNDEEAQLLRGEITRIDIFATVFGLMVSTYPYGWKASTRPLVQETHKETLEDALVPYIAQGSPWTIRRWADGARCWKGSLMPIRDTGTILRMRRQYATRPADLARMSGGMLRIDFAYDL